jgi:hypothetical protein
MAIMAFVIRLLQMVLLFFASYAGAAEESWSEIKKRQTTILRNSMQTPQQHCTLQKRMRIRRDN